MPPESEPEPEPESESDNNEEEEESDNEEEEEEEESESEEEESEEEESEEDESDEDLSNRETLRALLDPLGKDQLIELLKEVVARNPSLLSRISESAESDQAHRNIFVHGISWDCTTETLAASFRPFGDIEECHVVIDRTTGRTKGYGFVLFRTRRGARNALKEPNKVIGGRSTTCQLASKGYSPAADSGTGRKVFVSNIGANVNPERLEGVKPKVPQAMTVPAVSALPPNDLALAYASSYGNPAGEMLRQGMGVQSGGLLNPVGRQSGGVGLLNPVGGQSGGVGLLNPVAGVSLLANRSVTPTSYGARTGVNTVSPSVIGSYQSQAALQGLGGYQSQSAMNPEMRSQSSLGPSGSGLPSYLGR